MSANIPVLLIGKVMDDLNLSRIEWLIRELGDSYNFLTYGPVIEEPEVLDVIDKIKMSDSQLIVVYVLQGGSARAITLAAIKSGVPSAIWCHDEKHSLASSSIAAGALKQLDYPYVLLHGEEKAIKKELVTAVKAACALKALANARIGQLGPLHYNLVNSTVNPVALTRRFGTWVVPLSISSLKTNIKKIDDGCIEREITHLRSNYTVEVDESILKKAVAFRLALKDISDEKRLDAVAVDCWNEIVPELGINPCLEFAYNDFIIGCEGDIILAVTMIVGKAIGGISGYCGDLFSLDESTGTASLMHCTGCSELSRGEERIKITYQQPPNTVGLGDCIAVLQSNIIHEAGTILILHGENLEFLHLRRCEILRSDFSNQMQVFVKIEGDIGSFRSEAAGNHYAVFPGDFTDAWKTWAKWSGITVH